MIPREYYYHYNGVAVTGVPDKKGTRKLIGSKKRAVDNDNNSDNNPYMQHGYPGQNTIVTSDGYNSVGAPAVGTKPVMRSKWDRSSLGKSLEQREEERKRKEVEADIGQHCKSLRENVGTHLVSWSEKIPE